MIVAALALVGAVATALGFAVAPAQAAFAYLTAWAFAMSIALGALCLLAIGHAAGTRWTRAFQAKTERIVGALPVLAVLFVPIALSVNQLYAWTDLSRFHGEDLAKLVHKAGYLDVPFWTVRAAIFLAIWITLGELLVRTRNRALAAAALPILGLTLTFAAFDWLMSLTPLWYSTIFGLIYFGGGFVAAMALLAATSRATPDQTSALGRMILAFLILWAYLEFAQALIIWLANKPDEVPWYVARTAMAVPASLHDTGARGAGGWGDVFALLAIGGFVVPFFGLLPRAVKHAPKLLAIWGAWLVAMHYVDLYWLVMPVHHAQLAPHWLDLAAPCGVCGVAVVLARLRRRPPVEILPYEARS